MSLKTISKINRVKVSKENLLLKSLNVSLIYLQNRTVCLRHDLWTFVINVNYNKFSSFQDAIESLSNIV